MHVSCRRPALMSSRRRPISAGPGRCCKPAFVRPRGGGCPFPGGVRPDFFRLPALRTPLCFFSFFFFSGRPIPSGCAGSAGRPSLFLPLRGHLPLSGGVLFPSLPCCAGGHRPSASVSRRTGDAVNRLSIGPGRPAPLAGRRHKTAPFRRPGQLPGKHRRPEDRRRLWPGPSCSARRLRGRLPAGRGGRCAGTGKSYRQLRGPIVVFF